MKKMALLSMVKRKTPNVPSLNAITSSSGKANLSWKAVKGATSYNIYRTATPGAVPSYRAEKADPGTATVTYDDSGTTDMNYWYQITAVGTDGESRRSNTQTVKIVGGGAAI